MIETKTKCDICKLEANTAFLIKLDANYHDLCSSCYKSLMSLFEGTGRSVNTSELVFNKDSFQFPQTPPNEWWSEQIGQLTAKPSVLVNYPTIGQQLTSTVASGQLQLYPEQFQTSPKV